MQEYCTFNFCKGNFGPTLIPTNISSFIASHTISIIFCVAEFTLKNLTNKLRSVTVWYELGVQLNVPSNELDKIEEDYSKVDRRMSEVLKYWWRNCPHERKSWQTIANALKIINYRNLAEELENALPGIVNYVIINIIISFCGIMESEIVFL